MEALVILWLLAPAGFAAYLADAKGRNATTWFFLGLVFNVVGLITIAGLPSLAQELADADERLRRRRRLTPAPAGASGPRDPSSGWDPRWGRPPATPAEPGQSDDL